MEKKESRKRISERKPRKTGEFCTERTENVENFFNFPIFRGKWERFSTGRGEVKDEKEKHERVCKEGFDMQQWGEETKQLQICVNERKKCNLFGNLQILPLRCGKLCGKCSKLLTQTSNQQQQRNDSVSPNKVNGGDDFIRPAVHILSVWGDAEGNQ